MQENRTPQPTPEQLLRILDSQLAVARARRKTESRAGQRAALLIVGLLVIVASCGAAFLVLQQMLSDLRSPAAIEAAATPPSAVESAKFP